MNRWQLLFLNLRYYLRSHLAAVASMAVATAALTGALVIGDSIRGSLRQMTLERLGVTDYALVSEHFFRDQLAEDISHAEGFEKHFALTIPLVLVPGSVESGDGAFARGVQVVGADSRFWDVHTIKSEARETTDREALVNASLAEALGIQSGDTIIARFERADPIPADAVAGRKTERIESLRLTVRAVLPDRGIGRFSLLAGQQSPYNIFIPLATLQNQLKRLGEVNALLVASLQGISEESRDMSPRLLDCVREVAEVEDFGLRVRVNELPSYVSVESARMIVNDTEATAIADAVTTLGLNYEPTLTYLANTIRFGEKEIPYSTIAAINADSLAPLGPMRLLDDYAAPRLKDNEILLNEWAATRLEAKPGDAIRFTYYVDAPGGLLEEVESADFIVTGTVAMAGPGADPGLTPEYPGIHDASSMRDWDPPFPVDLSRIGDEDEAYWEQYKAAPKAFIALEAGRKMWKSKWGELTSIRVAPSPSDPPQVTAAMVSQELRTRLEPESQGLVFLPVKQMGLAASKGASDFSGLFIGFSFFIILSAMVLIRLFFALSVERRAREIGILLATGFTHGRVRRMFLTEAFLLSLVGAAVGVYGGLHYARLMLYGLATWWRGAVGTSFLDLHVKQQTLQIGFGAGIIVALLSAWFAVRAIGGAQPARLLAGGSSAMLATESSTRRGAWRTGILAFIFSTGAVGLTFYARNLSAQQQAGLFFGVGGCTLVAMLLWVSWWLRIRDRISTVSPGPFAIEGLGRQNAARNRSRSMLTAGLVASASFVIVAVAANRHDARDAETRRDSGNGGFGLMAESDAPVYLDLNSADSRADLGFQSGDEAALAGVKFFGFRENPGEDASCLNLYKPMRPRVLGAPSDFVSRGGFAFQSSLAESESEKSNPWTLLDNDFGDGIIPAITDFNTAMWILHSGLGKDLPYTDEQGREVKLRLVGLLSRSALQGELLIADERFTELFPSRVGSKFWFVETGAIPASIVRQAIEGALRDHGFDAYSPQERINAFLAVENTYLMTFLALGGIGLLLGTLGLAVVMLRNVMERRGELALLRAFGYTGFDLARIVMAENAMLLLFGLIIGSGSALLAVAPRVISEANEIPWSSIAIVLGSVFIVGVVSGLFAVIAAIRSTILDALRAP